MRRPAADLRRAAVLTGKAVAGAAAVALAARIEVPMVPVPMTLQTLAVLVVGGTLKTPAASVAMVVYLLLAAAGVPVLAGGGAGLAKLAGPTAGYLFAFVPAAALACAAAGRFGRRPIPLSACFIGIHGLILALGGGWLATHLGILEALAVGVGPFVLGAMIKSVIAAGLVAFARRAGPPSEAENPQGPQPRAAA